MQRLYHCPIKDVFKLMSRAGQVLRIVSNETSIGVSKDSVALQRSVE